MRQDELADTVYETLRYYADEHVPLNRRGVKNAGMQNLIVLEAALHRQLRSPPRMTSYPPPIAAPYHATHARNGERKPLLDYIGAHGIVLPEEVLPTYPLLRSLANYVEWKTRRQHEYRLAERNTRTACPKRI